MSRYYDPVTHRFINADGYFQSGNDILNANMHAYCGNNPIMNSDPSGQWFIKDIIKSVVKNVIKPIVKTVQRIISKVSLTNTSGFGGSVSLGGLSYSGQVGITTDTKGNSRLQLIGSTSFSAGSGSTGASFYTYNTVTNCSQTSDLNGMSYQIGGSYGQIVEGIPLVALADFNIIPNPNGEENPYLGITSGIGIGTPGSEGHVSLSYTNDKWDFNDKEISFGGNIFDSTYYLMDKMGEW